MQKKKNINVWLHTALYIKSRMAGVYIFYTCSWEKDLLETDRV